MPRLSDAELTGEEDDSPGSNNSPEKSSEIAKPADDSQPAWALEVDDVRKSFGKTQALRGATFRIRPGERVALLGPNGAGKTTLVRTICGRVKSSGGTVSLFGQKLTSQIAAHRLGLVPQELAIYGDLTAQENLLFFGRLHGLKGRELTDRVAWAMDWIALADRSNQLTSGFSGGMKRRVNIACGVLHQPGILLLDEPTVGVDPQSRQRIYDMLAELNRLGTTIVLTTHHLDEAESQCDRIVVLDHGRVIADGSIAELLQQTIGTDRQLRIKLQQPIEAAPEGFSRTDDGHVLHCSIENLSTDLTKRLAELSTQGISVADVEVKVPNLHHVFLHLTGRDLRE